MNFISVVLKTNAVASGRIRALAATTAESVRGFAVTRSTGERVTEQFGGVAPGDALGLVVGLVIWAGGPRLLVPIHMLLGVVTMAALLAAALSGRRLGAPTGLVVVALLWVVVTPAYGLIQDQSAVTFARSPVVENLICEAVADW